MAQWNSDLLNRYVAPGIAQFTAAALPEMVVEGEQVEHWMANHFLNNVFRGQFSGKHRQFAFNIIYRAQACLENYTEARAQTLRFLAESPAGNPRSGAYFRALRLWESCFLNFQMLVDLIYRLTGNRLFQADDGSPQQRAYRIANAIKHWGQTISRAEHHDDDTVPMWLTNTGFESREATLSYDQLAALLRDVSVVAREFMDPFKWHERSRGAGA